MIPTERIVRNALNFRRAGQLALAQLIQPHSVAATRFNHASERRQAATGMLAIDAVMDVYRDWLYSTGDGSARYCRDPENRDTWRSPDATVTRGCGDCEDLAILIASIFSRRGWHSDFVIGRVGKYGAVGEGHAWVNIPVAGAMATIEATTGELIYPRQLTELERLLGTNATVYSEQYRIPILGVRESTGRRRQRLTR